MNLKIVKHKTVAQILFLTSVVATLGAINHDDVPFIILGCFLILVSWKNLEPFYKFPIDK